MPTKTAAVHYFQCRASSNTSLFSPHLSGTTCGACKGMILEHIRAMDWSKLPDPVQDWFYVVADYLAR